MKAFLDLAQTKAKLLQDHGLDAPSWDMLEALALAEYAGQRLCVTELMRQREHGSPATIHRRLVGLRKGGFVEVHGLETDSRVKYLALSPRAQALLDELSQRAVAIYRVP
jgi:DNA-binding MarR family transcriptional regulator